MIVQGDCVALMAELPEASVDAIVTDPPYGLEFMGREWDRLGDIGKVSHQGPSERDGSTVFGRQRVAHNGSSNVRCRACSKWKWGHTPGDGGGGGLRCQCETPDFPSARPDQSRLMQEWHEAWAREALRVLKPGGHLLAFGGTRTYHRLACAVEDAGFEIRDCLAWLYGSGFPKSHNLNGDWQGWGTALKPAHEPIVMARKPLAGTVAQNVLETGCGALNIDGCRIGYEEGGSLASNPSLRESIAGGNGGHVIASESERRFSTPDASGRWPANVVLDEQAAAMLDEQTGERPPGGSINGAGPRENAVYGQDLKDRGDWTAYGDSGGASRFLYVAKASSAERNAGLDGFEPQAHVSMDTRGGYLSDPRMERQQGRYPQRNIHPTVKPIELMRWLVRLVTPPGGTILDPFTGSGTTGCAAALEGFNFIGMEREAEYVKIAEARIAWWSQHPDGLEIVKGLEADRERRKHADSGQLGLLS